MLKSHRWILAPALVITAALAAAMTGLTTELFRHVYIVLADAAGFGARDAGPGFLIASERLYSVGYWCTPTNLWVSAALLLSAARPGSLRFLAVFAVFSLVVSALMIVNVLVSFAVHPHVPSWNWGHIPGTFLLYTGAFFWCVRWVRREHTQQRPNPTGSAGDLTCAPTSSSSPRSASAL